MIDLLRSLCYNIFILNRQVNEMLNITLEEFKKLKFELYGKNPVIRPFDVSPIVADPSLLTPNESPDGRWHMFFHTVLGVYHTDSFDGISFRKPRKICKNAMRPNINYADGRYYLFYEKTRSLIANGLNILNILPWKSEIFVIESSDLVEWTAPRAVITDAKGFEKSERGSSISNPFYFGECGENRLYYSCGLTFIEDCGFCEPTHIGYAVSKRISDGYSSNGKMIISPDRSDPYLNLCSGCIKVYKLKDAYIGIQNGIYENDGKSHSAIILLSSQNAEDFRFEKIILDPGASEWMKQYVYASHLVEFENGFRLYFNARDNSNMLKGRECIGFCEAEFEN